MKPREWLKSPRERIEKFGTQDGNLRNLVSKGQEERMESAKNTKGEQPGRQEENQVWAQKPREVFRE